jgi:hypothetical protein
MFLIAHDFSTNEVNRDQLTDYLKLKIYYHEKSNLLLRPACRFYNGGLVQ